MLRHFDQEIQRTQQKLREEKEQARNLEEKVGVLNADLANLQQLLILEEDSSWEYLNQ
jgi:cell shape-determining protein MreC